MKRLLFAGCGHVLLTVLKTLTGAAWPDVEVVPVSP